MSSTLKRNGNAVETDESESERMASNVMMKRSARVETA
ncbi:hypothetical protein C7S13_5759 [Burkholderia cepacia]|nr:hypothetical protein [Burkholderia cepacia]